MILEVAILSVKKGLETKFETDFKKASRYISAIDGYLNHKLKKCLEQSTNIFCSSSGIHWKTIPLDLNSPKTINIGENY